MTLKSILLVSLLMFSFTGCTSYPIKTVEHVDLNKFSGKWYVLAGRFTPLETGVNNAIESYKLNPDGENIEISFTYNQDSFDGKVKSIPQKGWVVNKTTNAHWKVSPLWPLRFDYLIVALADDYSWTAIGVPDQDYLWIMARDYKNADSTIQSAVNKLKEFGYDSTIEVTVPHQYNGN